MSDTRSVLDLLQKRGWLTGPVEFEGDDGRKLLDTLVERKGLTPDRAREILREIEVACLGCGRVSPSREPRCPDCGRPLMRREGLWRAVRSDSGLPPDVEEARANPDNMLGRYVRLRQLGAGGMGVVWLAWDLPLSRRVALKLLAAPSGEESAEEIKRFHREAQTAGNLRHPNIVPIHDIGTHKDAAGRTLYFIAMEYIEGATLDRAALPLRRILEVMRDVARAVQFAHEQGVVHRDLKPANILIDSAGRPYVADFGLAKQANVPSSISVTGHVVGTPAFMAPEQLAGHAGPSCDIYSLGATLYMMATGRPAFLGDPFQILRAIPVEDPPRPRTLLGSVPLDVETITLHAMEKDAARRYGTARDFALDLERYLAGDAILARPVGPVTRGWRRVRKHPARAALVLCLGALFVLAGILWRMRRGAPENPPEAWVTVFEDDFDRSELGSDWEQLRPRERLGIHDGELCSRAGIFVLAHEVKGDVELEFEARVMPDSADCREISSFLHGSIRSGHAEGYALEFGLGENRYNAIQRLQFPVQKTATPLVEKGRRYRMRAWRIGDTVSYFADGTSLIEWRDPEPLRNEGAVGFASQCNHLHFDRVRVRQPRAAATAFRSSESSFRRVLRLLEDGRMDDAERVASEISKSSVLGVWALSRVHAARRRYADADAALCSNWARWGEEIEKERERLWLEVDVELGEDELVDFHLGASDRWRGVNPAHARVADSKVLQLLFMLTDERPLREFASRKGLSLGDLDAVIRWRSGDPAALRAHTRKQAEDLLARNKFGEGRIALCRVLVYDATTGLPTGPLRARIDELREKPGQIDIAILRSEELLLLADAVEGIDDRPRREALARFCRRGFNLPPGARHIADFHAGAYTPEAYGKLKVPYDHRPERTLRIGLARLSAGDRVGAVSWLERYLAARYSGEERAAVRRILDRLR